MRHVKRIVQGVWVSVLLAMGPLALAADRAWVPLPLPASPPVAGEVPVQLLALDCSWPLSQGPVLRARVRTAATVAIETVPLGSYVLVVGFGTRAHVVADRFVLTPYDREVLRQQAVDGLAMDDVKTDLAAFETLLSKIQVALVAAFGSRGFRLEIQVLSDGRPDPVDPRDQRTFDVLLGQPTTRSPLGGGVFAYAITRHQGPAHAPGRPSRPDNGLPLIPAADAATVPDLLGTAKPAAEGVSTDGSDRRIPWGWIVGGIVSVVVLGGCWAMEARRRGRRIVEETTPVQTAQASPPQPRPTVLVVTQYIRTPDGERRCVVDSELIPYAPGMFLGIGADPGRNVCVIRTPEAPARLALLQFDRDGYVTFTPGNGGMRLDDQAVEGPTRLMVDEPHVLIAGAVELHFELARQLPEAEEALLQRLQHPGQPPAQPATPEAEPRAVA